MLGHDDEERVGTVVGQRTGIHVGLIVHFPKSLLHLLPGRSGNIRTVVQHSVHSPHGNSCADCDILDSDLFGHEAV